MTAAGAPRSPARYTHVMLMVLLACLPGAVAFAFYFGWGVVLNLLWLPLLAVLVEGAILALRKQAVLPQLRDCSALVTGLLLALALPPTAPWWLGLAGIAVAIGIAKQLYGGIGRNVLNPAMAGYAFLLLVFPAPMTRWLLPEGAAPALPSLGDSLLLFFGSMPEAGIDAFTGATALDSFRHQRGAQLVGEFAASSPVMGAISGLGWEWINAGFLMGGLYLTYRRIVTWHIPASMLGALAIMALLFHDGGSSASGGAPLFHLFGGATMLGAFFVATDPVTAPATTRGKLVYGALIGALVYALRAWSSYPDGVAFAVLFGNLAAPLIDAYTGPRATPVRPEKPWVLTLAAVIAVCALNIGADLVVSLRGSDADRALLAAIMPAARHDNDLAASSFTLDPAAGIYTNAELLGFSEPRRAWRATLDGTPSGVILPVTAPQGYGGAIDLLVGIDADGVITGVRAVRHNESRGLGDALEPEVSNWILGFDNRSLENTDEVLWAVKKDGGDFDQFVGATITPRATINAVHDALEFFAANKERLLAE